MIVKAKLSDIAAGLTPQCERVQLRGSGAAAFVYAMNRGTAVEISEDHGGFWLEFWANSDDEDAAPVQETTVESADQAVSRAMRWLAGVENNTQPR